MGQRLLYAARRRCAASGGQSIEAPSSLKIMFLHFLIRKSGNDSQTRRCGTKTVA
jgi:hypothetical protein